MVEWLKQLAYALSLRLKSRARLEAENLVLTELATYYDAVRGLFILPNGQAHRVSLVHRLMIEA
jgi:hypothetical protein